MNLELLSPVGDFDCLRAAVQNGADSVYLGAANFNARINSTNFNLEELKLAIEYAKLREVNVYLTLNTLIKNNEFAEALELATKAYEFGIDAIIVQDLGLGNFLIKNIPNISIHASTQMTVHNLDGAKMLEELGYKRIVLARELSIEEITHICKNTNVEIEVFVHGALCVSYSGQCLFSSIAFERSGNRGKCAQSCRMQYDLIENEKIKDRGYLLSPKDICGLEYIPELIKAGVKCFKIEGRKKSPDYVACVTKIYRKYIDLAINDIENYTVLSADKRELALAFNRGGFSAGYLSNNTESDFVLKEKPNNMGVFIGNVLDYNPTKGYIKLNVKDNLNIGDIITFEKEDSRYTISEIMIKNTNFKIAKIDQTVEIGRMKGNININDNIYKLGEKELLKSYKDTYSGAEIKKIQISCKITIKRNEPIKLNIFTDKIDFTITSEIMPIEAINNPITKERIHTQLSKLGNTMYYFKEIQIDLDDNMFIQNISLLNDLRRTAIENLQSTVGAYYRRQKIEIKNSNIVSIQQQNTQQINPKINLLLNTIKANQNYAAIKNINAIYIPISLLLNTQYKTILINLSKQIDIYAYLPNITKDKYKQEIVKTISQFKIKGLIVSNISQIKMLKNQIKENNLELVGNYTLNVFNNETLKELELLGIQKSTISPELNKEEIKLINNANMQTELIIYGKTPLMTLENCIIQNTNKCLSNCDTKCSKSAYKLKDRMNFEFQISPNNLGTTTIYNSKITSIKPNAIFANSYRVDIIDETIEQINDIIDAIISGERLIGQEYTNGNLEKLI